LVKAINSCDTQPQLKKVFEEYDKPLLDPGLLVRRKDEATIYGKGKYNFHQPGSPSNILFTSCSNKKTK
jgi:hypothetical protein